MRMLLYLSIGLSILLLACLNAEPVIFRYYFGSQQLPLWGLLLSLFCLGVLVGVIGNLPNYVRFRLRHRQLQAELKRAKDEISRLRLLSLQDKPPA